MFLGVRISHRGAPAGAVLMEYSMIDEDNMKGSRLAIISTCKFLDSVIGVKFFGVYVKLQEHRYAFKIFDVEIGLSV